MFLSSSVVSHVTMWENCLLAYSLHACPYSRSKASSLVFLISLVVMNSSSYLLLPFSCTLVVSQVVENRCMVRGPCCHLTHAPVADESQAEDIFCILHEVASVHHRQSILGPSREKDTNLCPFISVILQSFFITKASPKPASLFSFHLGFSETSQAAVTSSAGVGHQLWFWTWSICHRLMSLPGDREEHGDLDVMIQYLFYSTKSTVLVNSIFQIQMPKQLKLNPRYCLQSTHIIMHAFRMNLEK